MRTFTGLKAALADYVVANARRANVDDAIRVIDDFCHRYSFLINVGDEKGKILETRSLNRPATC